MLIPLSSIGWVEFGDLLPYDPKKPYSYYIRGHTEPEPDCASGPSNGIRGNSTPQPHHGPYLISIPRRLLTL